MSPNDSVADATELARALEDIGATDADVEDFGTSTLVEFHTPLPGPQPIRSVIKMGREGSVEEATFRLGRLEQTSPHPSNNPDMVDRLARIATQAEPPRDTTLYVHFGRAGVVPRPHVILGKNPNDFFGSADREVRSGNRNPGPGEVVSYLERLIMRVRGEFFSDATDPADRITRQQAAQRQQFFDTRGTVSEFRQRIREQMATGVLEGLAGQGEIGVERLSRPGETTTRLDTPEGEVTLPREADNIFHDGDQFVRVWDFRPLRVEYTIDRQGVEPEHFLEVVGDRER